MSDDDENDDNDDYKLDEAFDEGHTKRILPSFFQIPAMTHQRTLRRKVIRASSM